MTKETDVCIPGVIDRLLHLRRDLRRDVLVITRALEEGEDFKCGLLGG